MGDPFQTFEWKGHRYVPRPGSRVTAVEGGPDFALHTVESWGGIEDLIALGLLVEVEVCSASKTFVPLPGQGGSMEALVLTCTKEADIRHKIHRDPNGAEWHG